MRNETIGVNKKYDVRNFGDCFGLSKLSRFGLTFYLRTACIVKPEVHFP
jgi:hypothetical protein